MVKQIFMSVFLFKKAFIKFYDLLIKSCPYKILHKTLAKLGKVMSFSNTY